MCRRFVGAIILLLRTTKRLASCVLKLAIWMETENKENINNKEQKLVLGDLERMGREIMGPVGMTSHVA